jgi:hypothetical protein
MTVREKKPTAHNCLGRASQLKKGDGALRFELLAIDKLVMIYGE